MSKCYFHYNIFCPFLSVLFFVRFENIGYRTDKKHDPPPPPPPPPIMPSLQEERRKRVVHFIKRIRRVDLDWKVTTATHFMAEGMAKSTVCRVINRYLAQETPGTVERQIGSGNSWNCGATDRIRKTFPEDELQE